MLDREKQETIRKWETKMATCRVGQVEDAAEAYLYCMKDRNLTGSVISTNGGALFIILYVSWAVANTSFGHSHVLL